MSCFGYCSVQPGLFEEGYQIFLIYPLGLVAAVTLFGVFVASRASQDRGAGGLLIAFGLALLALVIQTGLRTSVWNWPNLTGLLGFALGGLMALGSGLRAFALHRRSEDPPKPDSPA